MQNVDPAETVREYFAAWADHDEQRLQAVLADDVVATGPIATVAGRADHAASLVRAAALFDDIVVERIAADGPDVLTWFTFRSRTRGDMQCANWCHVVEGRIRRIRVTFDPRPLVS